MKPDGIIAKNEDEGHVPDSRTASSFAKYSVDLAYHDVPLYCLQVFVSGSNTADLLCHSPVHNCTHLVSTSISMLLIRMNFASILVA